MSTKVHFLSKPDDPYLKILQDALDDAVILSFGDEIPADTSILIIGHPKEQHLRQCPNLQAIVIPWAGLPETTRDLMLMYPAVTVHNLHHNAVPTAEMALTLLLAAAKFIVPADRDFRQHDWRPRYADNPTVILEDKNALILGYGAVGRHLGKLLVALGMHVMAVKRQVEHDLPVKTYQPESLPALLPSTDVLIITLPLTDKTRGLIGKQALSLLPRHAILVNVGRAAVVDEDALYYALRDGQLLAAGLDVWYQYPSNEEAQMNTPPSVYPFHELANVVMSPHRAGAGRSINAETRRMQHLAKLLNAAANGDPLPNQVNLYEGY